MKKLTVFSTAVIALALSAEVMAQTRGPRYNPGGGSSSGSSSSGSAPRGPSYNPGGGSSSSSSSRPSSSGSSSSSSSYRPSPSSSSSSTPRGPSYNPSPSRPSPSPSTTPRGPSYNPSPSRPSPSPSTTPRGPSYNPSPSRPSPSPSTTPRGPSYNPTPSTPAPSTTPTYTPSPSTSGSATTTTTPRGPRYHPAPEPTPTPSTGPSTPSTPRGPRYNPDPTPNPGPVVVTPAPTPRPTPGTIQVPRGPRYHPPGPNTPAPHRDGRVLVRRTVYHHSPSTVTRTVIVFPSPRDYHVRVSRHYIYRRWIQEPVIWTYTDGYWDIDGYPYYVDHGYRYRYNPVETCKYELVDGADYSVVRQFEDACNVAYDRCAVERDNLNRPLNLDRFFCAEAVDDDLVVEDTTEYNPLPTEMTPERRTVIESYLRNKTLLDIFEDGREGLGQCKIEKRFLKKCKYMVKVDGKAFPDPTGAVCSSPEKAALVGCQEETQKGNAGCILEKAILQGLCHP